MTVIAWDGSTLAADTLAVTGNLIGHTRKIHRVRGMLVGASGNSATACELVEWARKGFKLKDYPAAQKSDYWARMMVIMPDKSICIYENASHVPIHFVDKYYAIGCGSDIAMAIMANGGNAYDACAAACKVLVDCGLPITKLEWKRK